MVPALEVCKQVVSQPLEWLLFGVLEYVIFPDKAILWVCQRVELVEEQTFIPSRSRDIVDYDLELGKGWA